MESNLIQEDVFLFAPPSFENHHDDQRSCSGNGISSNGSFVGDKWTALIGTCKEADKNEMLLSRTNTDIIAQVYPSIVKVPWQDEVSIGFSKNGRSHVCLGISPSQFRRLLSSKRNAAHKSTRDAILYAHMAMQYTLDQIDQSKESGTSGSLIVLIVDAIQMFNYAVFNNKLLKTGTARKYALEEGARLIDVFIQARSQLAPELARRVTIIRWDDIYTNNYNESVKILQQYATSNTQFAKLVDNVVEMFIKVRKPNSHFTEEQHLILREYVFNELPALTQGIVYKNYYCSIIVHPVLSSDDVKNDDQRNVMLHLLNYVRHSSELRKYLNLAEQEHMCDVYDIAIPSFKDSLPELTS